MESENRQTHRPAGKPDKETLHAMLELGRCGDREARIQDLFQQLKTSLYVQEVSQGSPFGWLREMTWEDASAVVKALTRLEEERLTKGGGSVSSINSAFQILLARDPVQAMELAGWVVRHSRNPYVPFVFRKTREIFISVLKQCRDSKDCWEKMKEAMRAEEERSAQVAERVQKEDEEAARRREMLQEVSLRVQQERTTLQKAKSEAREKLLGELGGLPPQKRLEHIAWDDTRELSFYPDEFSKNLNKEFEKLDPETRGKLLDKLKARKTGPWRKAARELEAKMQAEEAKDSLP